KLPQLSGGLLRHARIHRQSGTLGGSLRIVAVAARAVGTEQLDPRRLLRSGLLREAREREKKGNQSLGAHEVIIERRASQRKNIMGHRVELLERFRLPGDDERRCSWSFLCRFGV